MLYIYTMEYYTVEKKMTSWNLWANGVDLENILLSEVTETQKDNYHMYLLISKWFLDIKSKENQPTNHNPREHRQQRGP